MRDILGEDGPWADYRAVTRVTFTSPEVGLRRADRGSRPASSSTPSRSRPSRTSVARGWIAKEEGLIKLVADAARGVLVGATVGRPRRWRGPRRCSRPPYTREIPVATLRAMHFAYPTYHRAIETALNDLDL